MSTTEDFLKDIEHITSYLKQQADMGMNTADLQTAQANTLAYKITTMRSLSASEGSRILQTLSEGPWVKGELATFLKHMNERIKAPWTPGPKRAESQASYKFELFLTGQDWLMLEDVATPICLKIACIVRRALGMGCYWPDATTTSRMACILQLASKSEVGVKAWAHMNILTQLKKHLKQVRCKTPFPLIHMEKFPDHPMQLPKEIFAHCYTESDPPRLLTQLNLDFVHLSAPKRTNHHTLKPDYGTIVRSDSSTSLTQPSPSKKDVLGVLSSLFGRQGVQGHEALSQASLQTPLKLTTPALKLSTTPDKEAQPAAGIPLALPKPQRVPAPQETDAEAAEKVADDEAIMNSAVAKKKGAKASGGKATQPTMKRPAAKADPPKVPKAMETGKERPPVVTLADGTRPSAPKESATATMLWRGGKIYQATDRKAFRVLKRVGDRVDVGKSWKKKAYKIAWSEALDVISKKNK